MEDKRKQFSADEFVNNEETPVETRNGYKVTIYCTDTNSVYCVRGAICINKDNLVNTWMPNGKYQSNNPIDKFDLFFSRKKTTRRMTCQELSRWLRDHPEEYREMTEFRIEEFIVAWRKASRDIAKHSYNMGYFEGVNAGFKMMEQVLDREDVPDPMPKELLRAFINEFRKQNEDNKQKCLNYED